MGYIRYEERVLMVKIQGYLIENKTLKEYIRKQRLDYEKLKKVMNEIILKSGEK